MLYFIAAIQEENGKPPQWKDVLMTVVGERRLPAIPLFLTEPEAQKFGGPKADVVPVEIELSDENNEE